MSFESLFDLIDDDLHVLVDSELQPTGPTTYTNMNF